MKNIIKISLSIFLMSAFALAGFAGDRFSLKDFKKALRDDASTAKNAELAAEVIKRGVSFEYTLSRENKLRSWGANEQLVTAIYQSIVDENDEDRLFSQFLKDHKSSEKEVRKTAFEKGKLYLSRFESSERFASHVSKLKEKIRYLECEFDASLGC